MSTSEEEWECIFTQHEYDAMAAPVNECINRHLDPSELDAMESEWRCMLDRQGDGTYVATFRREEDMERVLCYLRKE